ncbi:rapamycin-insensitive companion of mTOR-like, partial [Lampetra fluviatilis]
PDLVEVYLALILTAFIQNGLLQALVEVITTSDGDVSVRATLLLGELLYMGNSLLPREISQETHCLPSLVQQAAGDPDRTRRQ